MVTNKFDGAGSCYLHCADLAEKIVLITGGGSGIGEDLVYGFASQGAKVIFVDIDEDAANKVIRKATDQQASITPLFRPFDLSDVQNLPEFAASLIAEFGHIDILINNAGSDTRIKPAETDYNSFSKLRALNGDSPIFLTMAILEQSMVPRNQGSVLFLSSVHAQIKSDPNLLPYMLSKAAVNAFSTWVANTHGHLGIRSNAIMPGWIATEKQLSKLMTPDEVRECIEGQSVKRIGHPDDVTNMALFLVSSYSGFINGQVVTVDGGATTNFHKTPVPENIHDTLTRRALGLPLG